MLNSLLMSTFSFLTFTLDEMKTSATTLYMHYSARVPYSCDPTFVSRSRVLCERSEREISKLSNYMQHGTDRARIEPILRTLILFYFFLIRRVTIGCYCVLHIGDGVYIAVARIAYIISHDMTIAIVL